VAVLWHLTIIVVGITAVDITIITVAGKKSGNSLYFTG